MGDFLSDVYLWVKSFHVMAVIAWMAGLFYLPRLFVYHAEKSALGQDVQDLFQTMELKLYKVIMGPASIATSARSESRVCCTTPGSDSIGATRTNHAGTAGARTWARRSTSRVPSGATSRMRS